MNIEKVIDVLVEFNKWRRSLPPYEWNEDPSKQKEFPYSPKEVGVAIDEAIDCCKLRKLELDSMYKWAEEEAAKGDEPSEEELELLAIGAE